MTSKAAAAAPRAKSKGFTLIELMVAMVVSGIVLLGIFAFSSIQRGTADIHRRHVRIQQALEGSMYSISRDVRSAGLGFTRMCTELRVWDNNQARLINPGSIDDNFGNVVIDQHTDEPYWVLRDGIQGHWRSAGAVTIEGNEFTSASTSSAADSFDVVLGEKHYTNAMGVFTLGASLAGETSAANAVLQAKSASGGNHALDSGDNNHIEWVRQMFPPGSFVIIARAALPAAQPFRPESRGQCVLLQISDDVEAGGNQDEWEIPIGNQSGFNADFSQLFGLEPDNCPNNDTVCNDWDPAIDLAAGASIIPLGHLRWSRYEIDYSVPGRPYLVRSDFIGWQNGDPTVNGNTDYPDCTGNTCNLAQLHLPNAQNNPIPRVAIGPMIEDMQVAVGCDGYTDASGQLLTPPLPAPDTAGPGFEERGDETNTQPNKHVDEWTDDKTQDEWLGNAAAETWAPDCVWYGTAEEFRDDWPVSGPPSEQAVGPGFRMSPQTIRVTLLGKSETRASGEADNPADEFYNQLFSIEDRPKMDTVAGAREYLTLTERFSPRNLRWRDPLLQ